MKDSMRGVDRSKLACPRCGRLNDAHWQVEGEKAPEDGDLSICSNCITFGIYVGTPPTSIRVPTLVELTEIHADSEVQKAVRALTMLRSNG